MKKMTVVCFFALIFTVLSVKVEARENIKVEKSVQKILLNDKDVDIVHYNINGENYFMLRDVASILSGTKSQFNIKYDAQKNEIKIIKSESYFSLPDNEKKQENNQKMRAIKSNDKIYIEDKKIDIKAFKIDSRNFYRLRDIAKVLDFDLFYDNKTESVNIKVEFLIDKPESSNEQYLDDDVKVNIFIPRELYDHLKIVKNDKNYISEEVLKDYNVVSFIYKDEKSNRELMIYSVYRAKNDSEIEVLKSSNPSYNISRVFEQYSKVPMYLGVIKANFEDNISNDIVKSIEEYINNMIQKTYYKFD